MGRPTDALGDDLTVSETIDLTEVAARVGDDPPVARQLLVAGEAVAKAGEIGVAEDDLAFGSGDEAGVAAGMGDRQLQGVSGQGTGDVLCPLDEGDAVFELLAECEFECDPLLRNQSPRAFSIANAPHDDEFIELDAEGNPIKGYTLRDCPEIYGDDIRYTVRWKKAGGDVRPLAGDPTQTLLWPVYR